MAKKTKPSDQFRQSQLNGHQRLLGLREKSSVTAEEMADARPRFKALTREDSAPRVVSAFNLFQTPDSLARRMAGMLEHQGRLLEPSAGLGRLLRAIREKDTSSHITLVEQSPDCCRELYLSTESDPACKLIQGDFLQKTPDELGLFDGIVMNPPFRMRSDIAHISHALGFLASGGRLVGLCANSRYREEKLRPLCSFWEVLPENSFASEGTRVSSVLLVIDK